MRRWLDYGRLLKKPAFLITSGVLCVGGSLMADCHLKPGDLMAFLVAAQTIQRSLAQLSLLFGQAIRGMSAGSRVFEYIELQPQIPLRGGDDSVQMKLDDFVGKLRYIIHTVR